MTYLETHQQLTDAARKSRAEEFGNMYDDTWYNTFAPSPRSRGDKPKHGRRESLLRQPSEGLQADVRPVETNEDPPKASDEACGPPQATLTRRAKSYSDFYDAARAYLKKERRLERQKQRSAEHLENELDFEGWYHGVNEGLLNASQQEYQLYYDQLSLSGSHLDTLLDNTASALDLLSSLSASFKAVEAQTTAFQRQCEGLLADQKRLTKLSDDISENLRYYTYLEPITRRLNAPGAGSFVRGKEFSEMLSNLDNCLDYMQAHPTQREASTYRSRYRLLLTRALTLIRVHFTNSLREIAADVSKRISDRQLNDTTMSALLYAKFRVGASELKQIGLEIQKRAVLPAGAEPGAEAEYQSLMNELYQSYSATRGRLILPIVTKKMAEIAMAPSSSKDLVAFARSSISYVRGVCFDEHDLWGEWFATEAGLYDFLEAMCEPLYDHLRPRTIHETQLLKLCELCTLIQTRYMEEDDEDAEPLEADRLDFAALIQPALHDAQTRLVFLALAVIRDEIEHYRPKPEDLDYPARNRRAPLSSTKGNQPALSGRRGSTNGPLSPMPKAPTIVEDGDGIDPYFDFNAESTSENWYPTLRKAIWLLSRIYRLVNPTVFDDLAQQTVHQTTLSLHAAAVQISTRASPTDAQLFLIAHLLQLKRQLAAFDIDPVAPDVSLDFGGVATAFHELRGRGRAGLLDPRNLVRLVGGGLVPRVVESLLDARAELDAKLRAAIGEFTEAWAVIMARDVKEGAGKERRGADAGKATSAVREAVLRDVPVLRGKLDEYIEDVRTKETLVAAVQDQVVLSYEAFYEKVVLGAKAGGKGGSKKGKGREDEVWDPDAFADWAASIFGVGRLGVGDVDEEERRGSGSSRGSFEEVDEEDL